MLNPLIWPHKLEAVLDLNSSSVSILIALGIDAPALRKGLGRWAYCTTATEDNGYEIHCQTFHVLGDLETRSRSFWKPISLPRECNTERMQH
jgi:hypothetical protein